MPCENCNVQFTVFKRKKSCLECRRLYCSNCLVKQQKEVVLCHKCVIFKRRPLTKIELLKLKSKDLIFYLQSKHISTTGCVEKEELVNLVLSHIHSTNYTENIRSPNSSYSSSSSRSNQNDLPHTFDTIKQTCQNLFTSFTDKITTDLNFDSGKTNNNNQNIFCQPRRFSRPTENIYNNQPNNGSSPSQPPPQHQQQEPQQQEQQSRQYNDQRENYNNSSQISSPRSNDSTSPLTVNGINSIFSNHSYNENNSDNNHSRNNVKLQAEINLNENRPGTSGQNHNNINTRINHNSSNSKRLGTRPRNESDSSTTSSSFEELGAIGGTSNSDIENWHFVQNSSPNINGSRGLKNKNKLKVFNRNLQMNGISTNSAIDLNNTQSAYEIKTDRQPRQQLLTRRRSDTFIIMNPNILLEKEKINLINVDMDLLESSRKRSRKCCRECGVGLKKHLSKFRHQLESSNLTENEKKNRIEEFLHSLENKCTQGQFQHNDLGSPVSADNNDSVSTNANNTDEQEEDSLSLDRFTNENDGINVYPTISFMYDEQGDEAEVIAKSKIRGRLKLNDISSRSDLEELSVKQLKEILMLNRVDFKGCCEKTELLERVYRLWKDHMATPAVEKLTTEDLCKICMDAPIECVILECGHMVTCTSCGKVLNECPICRQYIVRVVRFFRA